MEKIIHFSSKYKKVEKARIKVEVKIEAEDYSNYAFRPVSAKMRFERDELNSGWQNGELEFESTHRLMKALMPVLETTKDYMKDYNVLIKEAWASYLYIKDKSKVQEIANEVSLAIEVISSVEDLKGIVWAGSSSHFGKIDKSPSKILLIRNPKVVENISAGRNSSKTPQIICMTGGRHKAFLYFDSNDQGVNLESVSTAKSLVDSYISFNLNGREKILVKMKSESEIYLVNHLSEVMTAHCEKMIAFNNFFKELPFVRQTEKKSINTALNTALKIRRKI